MTDTGIHKYFYEEAWTCLLFVYVLFSAFIYSSLFALFTENTNPAKPELKPGIEKHKFNGNIHPSQALRITNTTRAYVRINH